MSGWLKARTCLFGELEAHSSTWLIAVQPGVTVRATVQVHDQLKENKEYGRVLVQ
jgi:hypothetical protein